MDPVEFRLKNLLHEGDQFATGERVADVAFEVCLRDAAQAVNWQDGASADLGDGRVRGKGVCVLLKGMTTPSRSTARVEIDHNGQITVYTGTIELGQGARTVAAQVAADVLGVSYDRLTITLPDTSTTPFDVRTTSSRSTYMMGQAIRNAERPGQPVRPCRPVDGGSREQLTPAARFQAAGNPPICGRYAG
jgi:CO/xanthine dehydrogenase Mo-binding subunit